MPDNSDQITVVYKFIKAKKQDLAKMAAEELKRVRRNQKILKDMRKQKRLKEKEELLNQSGSSIRYEEEEDEDDDDDDLYEDESLSPAVAK